MVVLGSCSFCSVCNCRVHFMPRKNYDAHFVQHLQRPPSRDVGHDLLGDALKILQLFRLAGTGNVEDEFPYPQCRMACPGDAILHWGLDKKKCSPYASPHGFSHLVSHVSNVLRAGSTDEQIALLRSGDSFNLWQTMLRGVGAYTGCTRCIDVCPVGQDYARKSSSSKRHH